MKHVFKNRIFMAVLVALTFGSLGYYFGSRADSNVIANSVPSYNYLADSCMSGNYADTISKTRAYEDIERYGLFAGKMDCLLSERGGQSENIHRFKEIFSAGWTIPMDDLHRALNCVASPRYVRAYLGIKDSITSDSDTLYSSHLILTIVNGYKGIVNPGQDSVMNSYYDLIRPCPHMCDHGSPLYRAYNNGLKSAKNDLRNCK